MNKFRDFKPIDWAFLIGGPIAFLAIAWFGLQAILGPAPPLSPVQKLKQGAVKPGLSEADVLMAVGEPKSVSETDSGATFRYQGSLWNAETKTFTEEDVYVDFDSAGRVTSVSFEARTPPPSSESNSSQP